MDFLKNIFENRIAGSGGNSEAGGSGNIGGLLSHTVSFTVDGNDYAKFSVADGVKIPEPVKPEAGSGRLFRYWTDGGNSVTFPYTPQSDKIFIANISDDLSAPLYEKYSDKVTKANLPYVFIWKKSTEPYTLLYFTNVYRIENSGITISAGGFDGFKQDTSFVDDITNVAEVVEHVLSLNIYITTTTSGAGGIGSKSADVIYTNVPINIFSEINAQVYQI